MKNNIQTTDWLIKDISKEQLQTEKALALIANKISNKRYELKMDQKEFAKYMNVTQGLVSRWESGRYNFTVSNLISICNKLELSLDINLLSVEKNRGNIIFVKQSTTKTRDWASWQPTKENLIYGGAAS